MKDGSFEQVTAEHNSRNKQAVCTARSLVSYSLQWDAVWVPISNIEINHSDLLVGKTVHKLNKYDMFNQCGVSVGGSWNEVNI